MIAILSDIHGNLEALTAVLEDINNLGIKTTYSLGDVVGYGPNPKECLDALMPISNGNILGNHEDAVMTGNTIGFSTIAEESTKWTAKELFGEKNERVGNKYNDFITKFSIKIDSNNGILFVHGSPRQPTHEYVMPQDAIIDPAKMNDIFSRFNKVAFCGHTHRPGVFSEGRFIFPNSYSPFIINKVSKALINVGSVGQPRDGDPRACYVVLDGDSITWKRIKYDIPKTVAKMKQIEELHPFLAERLPLGR